MSVLCDDIMGMIGKEVNTSRTIEKTKKNRECLLAELQPHCDMWGEAIAMALLHCNESWEYSVASD